MAEDAIDRLERVLREEREAIRRLDGDKVLAFAEEKKALLAALRRADGSIDRAHRDRLRALTPALRHNGVLLAHARDILRDSLAAARSAQSATAGPGTARPAGPLPRLLSVRG